jgi:glyoxylase I family protein
MMTAEPLIQKLHHFAYRCRDAEETRAFYEDLLGLPLCHVVSDDVVGSTGEACSFVHLFFRMADGSSIAFFDLGDGKATVPDPNTPAWCNHIAFEVPSMSVLKDYKKKLEAAGVEVRGITDHDFVQSIYFFDPNGVRLELNVRSHTDGYMVEAERHAHDELAKWTARRRQAAE